MAINVERLLNLADILDAAHERAMEFSMGTWFFNGPLPRAFQRADCGTPACALGHYAAANPNRWETSYDARSAHKWNPVRRDLGGDNSMSHAMEEFGISDDQARELFSANGCGNARTAKQAADYVRGFVERNAVCKEPQ